MSDDKKKIDIGKEIEGILVDDLLGAEDWKASKRSWFLGTGAIKRGWKGFANGLAASHRIMKTMAKGAFGKETAPTLPTSESDPAIRFEVARLAYGRTKKEVDGLTRHTARMFNLYFVLSAFALSLGIVLFHDRVMPDVSILPSGWSSVATPFAWAWPFFLLFALVPKTAKMSFLNWQLRTCHLGSFWDWARQPGLWMAVSHGGLNRSSLNSALLMLASATMLAPSVAYAATANSGMASEWWSGHVSNNDIFYIMMQMVLGGVGPIADTNIGPTVSATHAMVSTLNAMLLQIGTMMLGWHTFAGTVSTAHEGKVLGQRYHEIWAPIRVIGGVGSLAPVAKGFCAAQLLIIHLSMWGLGLANAVFNGYVDSVTGAPPSNKNGANVAEMFQAARGGEIVESFIQKQICYDTIHGYIDKFSGSSFDAARNPVTKGHIVPLGNVTRQDKDGLYTWDFGPVCGQIALDFSATEIDAGAMGNTDTNQNGMVANAANKLDIFGWFDTQTEKLQQVRVQNGGAVADTLDTMRTQAVQELATQVVSLAQQKPVTAEEVQAKYAETLAAAKQAYAGAVRTFVYKIFDSMDGGNNWNQQLREQAHERGWASAGVLYVTLMRLQGQAYSLSNIAFTATPINMDLVDEDTELYTLLMGDKERIQTGSLVQMEAISSQALSAGLLNGDTVGGDGSWFSFDTLMKFLVDNLANVDPINPMSSMIGFGHAILNLAWTVLGVVIGAEVLAALAKFIPGLKVVGAATSAATGVGKSILGGLGSALGGGAISALLAKIGFLFWMVVAIIIATGAVHAYVIPMIPFGYMTFAVMGNLILLMEGIVAASLWAFFHIRMDGNELIDQKQAPGYQVAFNIFLRGTMTVFGFAFSMAVFGAMAWFLSITFVPAARAAGDGHTVGVIGIIVMLVIATYLNFQVALRSFSLITSLPDRISRWWGAQGENLGEENDTSKAIAFMTHQVSNRMEGELKMGGMRGGGGKGGGEGADGKAPKPKPGQNEEIGG